MARCLLSLQNAFVGLVKSTNKKEFEIRPLETVTESGFVRKNKLIETAVTESSEKGSSKIRVCPRVVSMTATGKNQRLPVLIYSMSAKTIKIRPNSTLCELQEVKILRNVNPVQETANKDHVAVASQFSVKERKRTYLPEGVELDSSILNSKQKEMAANLFHCCNKIFSTGITDI